MHVDPMDSIDLCCVGWESISDWLSPFGFSLWGEGLDVTVFGGRGERMGSSACLGRLMWFDLLH